LSSSFPVAGGWLHVAERLRNRHHLWATSGERLEQVRGNPNASAARIPYFCVKLALTGCSASRAAPLLPPTLAWQSGQIPWLTGEPPGWSSRPHQAQTTAGDGDGDGGMKSGL
jgi:hypothetical protein